MRTDRVCARRRPGAFRHAVLWLLLAASFPMSRDACAATWDPLPADVWSQAARPDSGGRDAIVLLEEGAVEDRQDGFSYRLFRRQRIFTDEGRDAGKVDIDYLKKDNRLLDVRARSVREDGTITELTPDQIITSTVLKSGGVDYTRASFIVPGIEPGCVVEYGYTITGKHGGLWVWPWYFQNPYYTVESRYRWQPLEGVERQGLKPQWVLKRIAESRAAPSCMPDCSRPRTISFVAHAIPGAREEEWTPPLKDAGPQVIISYVPQNHSSLEFWSLWKGAFDDMAKQFGRDLGGLETVVKDAQRRSPEPEAALIEVHDWLRSHVRSTGERSWQDLQKERKEASFWGKESSVAGLIKRGEGSPFEINLAFAAAAQALGFDARVVLVRDRREGAFEHRLIGWPPTEAITVVVSKSSLRKRYYDPASRFAIAGNVPWYLRGGSGLVAGSGSDLILNVSPDAGVPARTEWSLDLTLDPAGEIAGRVDGRIRGEQARARRSWLWSEDPRRWPELLADRMKLHDALELELSVGDLSEPPDSAFALSGSARYPGITSTTGELVSVPVEKLVPWRLHAEFESERRTQAVFFECAHAEQVTLDLHLPAGAAIEALPSPGYFENGAGSWNTRWTRTDDGVRLERKVEVRYAEFPPQDYPAVRALWSGLAAADREVLLIRKP